MNLKRNSRCKLAENILAGTLLIAIFVPEVSHALSVSVSENSRSVERYDIYELTMSHSGSYSNPWEDVVITAAFTSPSGVTYTTGGFYYDTNTWKLRFAAMEEGTWTWDLTFDVGRQMFADSGLFNCVSSNKSGFLRIHPQNPYRFITERDGKAFYPIGFNDGVHDQLGANGFGGPDGTLDYDWSMDADYVGRSIDDYFGTFSTAGNNVFRMNTEVNTYKLWDQFNIGGTGRNTYKILEGKMTDQLAAKLHEVGMKFYMVFRVTPGGYMATADISDPTEKQAVLAYHKYVIDRWGAYVDIWELLNEQDATSEYYTVVPAYVRSCDPYDHIITTSQERPDLASIELTSPHEYNGVNTLSIDSVLAGEINNWKTQYAKPVLFGEFGNRVPYTNYDPQRYRIFIWTAMFNEGGVLFWHSGFAKGWKGMSWGGSSMYIGPEERAFSMILSNFTMDFDPLARPISVGLNPMSEIRAHALGSSEDIGIYFTHTASHTAKISRATVTVDIPEDGMKGLWCDPSTGKTLESFVVDSGSQTLVIPAFQADIALRIRRGNVNWIPVADAGPDQTAIDSDDDGVQELTFDGSSSYDSDGAIASYLWSEDDSLIATGVDSTVTLPVGMHTITLLVTDDEGLTDTDEVRIAVKPANTPTITVLSPNGGESYTIGQAITVTWTSTNFTGNVRIDFYKGGYPNGEAWDWFSQSTANDGSWSWTVPNVTWATGWKFRIAAAGDREPSDESDGTFSIIAP